MFFSVPTWVLTDGGWPTDVYPFTLALLIGASGALVLCHITPAIFGTTLTRLAGSRMGASLRWPASAWFCLGAAFSLAQTAHFSGAMLMPQENRSYLNESSWTVIYGSIVFALTLASIVLGFRRIHSQRPVVALCLIVGSGLILTSPVAQSNGLRARPLFVNEELFDHPYRVAEGMITAAAPVSILALRISRLNLPSKKIWWTGFFGVWLPLAASVALISVAKVGGGRLDWKPSLSIEFPFALSWLFRLTNRAAVTRWLLCATTLAPCLVYAIWIKDLTHGWRWNSPRMLALAAIAIVFYRWTAPETGYSLYSSCWAWSIIAANLMLCAARLLRQQ